MPKVSQIQQAIDQLSEQIAALEAAKAALVVIVQGQKAKPRRKLSVVLPQAEAK